MKTIYLLTIFFLFATAAIAQTGDMNEAELPEAVKEFIYDNEDVPFGEPAENAGEQVKAMAEMRGVWLCTTHVEYQGKEYSGWPALWAFKYVLGGFAIEDLWYQEKENFPPPMADLEHDFQGINLRIYDRLEDNWDVVWFHNGQRESSTNNATNRFTAEYKDGKYIMTQPHKEEGPWSRITFSDMNGKTFEWKSEVSEDGETWKVRSRITGERVL